VVVVCRQGVVISTHHAARRGVHRLQLAHCHKRISCGCSFWGQFPFMVCSLPSGAVSSRMPCSYSTPRRQGKHGRIQGCVLLVMRWVRSGIARRRPRDGSPLANGRYEHDSRAAALSAQSLAPRAPSAATRRRSDFDHDRVAQPGQRQFNTAGRSQMQATRMQVGTINVGSRGPATPSRRSCCGRCSSL